MVASSRKMNMPCQYKILFIILWSPDRLSIIMRILIPGKMVFISKRGPGSCCNISLVLIRSSHVAHLSSETGRNWFGIVFIIKVSA